MDAWKANPIALAAFRRGGVADFEGRARSVVEWAERELAARISGLYGSSELFALTAIWPDSPAIDIRVRAGGLVVSDGIEVRAADPETGAPCAPGEVGELQFRGYNVLTDYRGNPEAAQQSFTPDGWFRSKDLGSLTAEPGAFVYVCRSDDALRLRGFLVDPAEIEAFLMSHPQVHTAKVVAVRDDRGTQRAVAYATSRTAGAVDADELADHCRRGLAAFKVPSAINVIPEFPVTTSPNGTKIRTAELRRWAEAQIRGPQPSEIHDPAA
jgi:fatty-acyl-CoA synthase